MIDEYEFGRIKIGGKGYAKDVIIIEGEVFPNWRREEGHFLRVSDLGKVWERKVKVFVVGTGHSGVMKVGEEVREYCKENGIELIEMTTGNAVKKFNELSGKKKDVAGAFHLTC